MMAREITGPNEYWSEERKPSRGQVRDIAILAMQLLDLPIPQNRLEATILQVRLRRALTEKTPVTPVPEPWGESAEINRRRVIILPRAQISAEEIRRWLIGEYQQPGQQSPLANAEITVQ